jgi:hypothetical protein
VHMRVDVCILCIKRKRSGTEETYLKREIRIIRYPKITCVGEIRIKARTTH